MENKKEQLTTEEKLKQALILPKDQPYLIPKNWVWTRIDVINCYQGKSVNPATNPREFFELYSVPSCENNYPQIVKGSEIGSTKQSVQKDDVLLCKINPRINRVWRVTKYTEHILLASSEWIVIRNRNMSSKYLMWLFQSKYFRELMLSNVSGVGGSLMRAQPKYVKKYSIPIPPFAEQQRIVECIERLFAKLDNAKELIMSVVDGLETRKVAILHKTFTGELSAKWREEHDVKMDSWQHQMSKDLFEYVTSGSRGWAQYYADSGAVFIRMGNLNHGTIELDFTDTQYVNLPDKIEGQRSKVQKGDILLSITADVGMVGFVRNDDIEAYINQHVAMIRPKLEIYSEYLAWYLVSDLGLHQLQEKQRGATKVGLTLRDLRSLNIIVPTYGEQQEIVRILDRLFEKEKKANELVNIIEKIDSIKKAILARAFRGELDTNNPEEESAMELLKEMILDTMHTVPKGKKIKSQLNEVKTVTLTITEVLKKEGQLTPEKLKKITELEIDDFYEQVKKLVDQGAIQEIREIDEIYLEAVNHAD